jgi:Ca2+-binding EF-hand superfamily protein
MLLAPLLLSLAPAAAQVPTTPPAVTQPANPAYTPRRGGRLFISPMGEPFRPSGRDDDALADWFQQADQDHDGHLTLQEMQQDADRFFATLDVSHDGEIDPDDITRYENEVAPEITSGSSFGIIAADSGEGGREGGRGGHHRAGGGRSFRGGANDLHQGAGRFGLLDLPEPVVSADTNFNRGISQAEFRQAAAQRFIALDLDHHGYLSLATLETIRPAPPAAPNAPQHKDVDESALPNQPY